MTLGIVVRWSLRLLLSLAVLLTIGLLVLYAGSRRMPAPGGEVMARGYFINTHVVDVKTGTVLPDMAIEVRDGRIVAVTPMQETRIPEGRHVEDMGGAFALPGLWDMHVHLLEQALYTAGPAQVMNGVMYVREMGSDCVGESCGFNQPIGRSREIQAAAASGELLAPIFTELSSFHTAGRREGYAGRYGYPEEPSFLVPRTEAQGRALVRYFVDRGVDFIKTYDSTEVAALRGMYAEASGAPLYIGGHVPKSFTLGQALQIGQRSIEHARMLPMACSGEGDDFAGAYARWASSDGDAEKPELSSLYDAIVDGFEPRRCDEILAAWADSDAVYVPTHVTRRTEFTVHTRAYEEDPRTRYVPGVQVELAWGEEARDYAEQFLERPDDYEAYRRFFRHGIELTGRAHRAGVKLLVGTDSGDTLIYPGFSYADELALYAQAGIPAPEILRMATIAAARFSGMDDDHGSIDPGKAANLLFLKADPTADVGAVRDIAGIFYQSAHYAPGARQDVLDQVADNANGPGQWLTIGWWLITDVMPTMIGGDGVPLSHGPH